MRHIVPFLLLAPLAAVHAAEGQTGVPHRFLGAGADALIAIVGRDDRIEWQRKVPGEIHEAVLLPNGHVLMGVGWTRIVELDIAHGDTEVWSYDSATMNGNAGKRVEIHSFERLADGSTMIIESGPARIIEVDAKGTLLRATPLTTDKEDAHRDSRHGRKLATGNYLVAQEGDHKVREYESGTGKVVWTYDCKSMVFSAVRLVNGNTLIGDGNGHQVIEVDRSGATVWSVGENELPGIKLVWVAQIERLANGNTVIVNCHAGPDQPQMIEITADKKVVWTMNEFKRFGNGMPVGQDLDAGAGVIR